ncbi:MAG TPA: efflux RND transporter permease subunit [Kofleriaceae bacterium]|jgi:multidrug efflux pump subunit AcrB
MTKWLVVLALVACKSPPASVVIPAAARAAVSKGPSIVVDAWWPGASSATMAAAVASPLERELGQIPELTWMTSRSRRGETTIRLDFTGELDDAARAVQLALDAARPLLPVSMPNPPTYDKVGRDPPVMRVTLGSETLPLDEVGAQADEVVAQKLSQVAGVGRVSVCGFARPEWHVTVDAQALAAMGKTIDQVVDEVRAPPPPDIGSALAPDAYLTFSIDKLLLTRTVATLERSSQIPDCIAFDAGHRVVIVTVRPQPGADRAETRAGLDAVLPLIEKELPGGIHVHALPLANPDDDELTTGSDASWLRRIEDASYIASHAGDALVELGVDLNGDHSPETIAVHGADRVALAHAALDRQLVLHDRDEHVVGLQSVDPAQLNDALARDVAALTAANVPVRGTLGATEAIATKLEIDRDRMAKLGIVDDTALATAIQAMAPEGIVASALYTQRSVELIVVRVHEPELSHLYVRAVAGGLVPLDAFVKSTSESQPTEVLHKGLFPWVGIRVGGTREALDAALAHIPVAAGVYRDVAE